MKKEYLLAGMAILFWGSSASVGTLMVSSLSTISVVFFGSLTAAVFLFLFCLFTGRLKFLRALSLKELVHLGLLGLLGMLAVNLFYYNGLSQLKAQQAFIINYLWPILIVLFSCLLLGERMTAQKGLALALSFFGVVIVATEGNLTGLGRVSLPGVLSCVADAVCYALFSVFNVKVTCDKFVAMTVYYGATTLAAFPLLLAEGPIPVLSLSQWGGLLWIGVLINGLGYTTWAIAMDIGDTAKLSNLAYLTPFVSLVYIFLLLHEPIGWASFVGLFFIVSGVLVQLLKRPLPLVSYRHSHSH